jgi:hypothetical protein
MKTNYRKIPEKEQIIMEREVPEEGRIEFLDPGVYKLHDVGNMFIGAIPLFENLKEGDKLVMFKTGIVSDVVIQADKFFSEETKKAYEELKITHKMGLLFFGKQGTGKTSTCVLIMKALVERHNAICLDCTNRNIGFIKHVVGKIREIQQNPIVLFVDEFETKMRGEEDMYLTFLDGNESVNNLIFMGCTNYIEKIPDRIKKRKSRIKHSHKINSLPEAVYKEYVSDRVPTMDQKTVTEFSFKAAEKGLTIDQLKHALIDYRIEGLTIDRAIAEALKFGDDEQTW